jgi:site-specific recombinase XerD
MENSSLIIKKDSNNLDSYKNIPEELIWYQNITSIYTRRTYQDSVRSFCKFFNIKNIEQLRDVDSIHIIKYRDELIKEGHKNSTINTRLASLSSMFKHLIEKQLLKTNPVYGVKRMKKQYRKVKSRPLTDIEVSAILKQPNTKMMRQHFPGQFFL